MEEPSLLDYLKSKISLNRLRRKDQETEITSVLERNEPAEEIPQEEESQRKGIISRIPWRTLLALGLALLGQRQFEPADSKPVGGIVFYFAAFCMLIYALLKREWQTPVCPDEISRGEDPAIHRTPLYAFIPLVLLAFIAFSGNQFTAFNLILWIAVFIAALSAFWQRSEKSSWNRLKERVTTFLKKPEIKLRFSYWTLLVVVVFGLAAYFHLSHLSTVPLDMTSDHAEKLLDVNDVLNGSSPIFFNRNAGREPIQFYLTAMLIKVFGMSIGFTTLKFGMALAFLVSLFYVYRLGKEVGNRWTGLLAMLLLGFASWTNILARVGMRLVLTPVFVAPVLFYLLRGFRKHQRNDLILAGIFLGLGMMGYSAFRIVPLAVIAGMLLFLTHQKSRADVQWTWKTFGILVVFAVVAALPILRFATQYPDLIGFRTLTRMTGVEQPIAGPVYLVFLQNLWNAVTMPFWRDGNTWVISVTGRPALDLVSAALYLMGVVMLIYAWAKNRNWQYSFLLVSIPVLMLPSVLALAFPNENPSLSRAGGAVIPVILICAIGLETLLSSLWKKAQTASGKAAVVVLAGIMILLSARQNYDLVFDQYNTQYINATWNTSQMGQIAKGYIDSVGSPDTVYVVAKAYWVDTRLVAMNAGYITRDYQIWPADLENTLSEHRTKLFFVKADDNEGMAALKKLYPNGTYTFHPAAAPGRDFYTYLVPSQVNEP